MADLVPFSEILGYWLAIFLTLAILSFLYKDNPFYKLAEHLFIGVSIGYIIAQQYYDVLEPKLVDNVAAGHGFYFIPLLLALMMFPKLVSPRWAWLGRYPLAFVVALYAGININAQVQADLGAQLKRSMHDLDSIKVNINDAPRDELTQLPGVLPPVADAIIARRADKPFESLDEIAQLPSLTDAQRSTLAEERGPLLGLDARAGTHSGEKNLFKIFSEVLLLLGLLASLIYFYFSIEQKGAVGKVSRFGVWILMIGFGASFGYTVQGRLALAIGRALDVLGEDKPPDLAARIHGPLVAIISIVILVAGIVVWELAEKRKGGSGGSGSTTGS
jgi:hypothetical protein